MFLIFVFVFIENSSIPWRRPNSGRRQSEIWRNTGNKINERNSLISKQSPPPLPPSHPYSIHSSTHSRHRISRHRNRCRWPLIAELTGGPIYGIFTMVMNILSAGPIYGILAVVMNILRVLALNGARERRRAGRRDSWLKRVASVRRCWIDVQLLRLISACAVPPFAREASSSSYKCPSSTFWTLWHF